MKLAESIIKLGLAIAAIAGIAFLIVKYMDAIKAWLEKLCPVCEVEDDVEVEITVEDVAAVEEPVAEAAAPEAPVAEEIVIEEGTPVAEEADFEA